MLDITKLLQSSISFDRQMTEQKDILLGPEARQINAMTTLDIELGKLYQLSHWNEVWHDQETENLTELTRQFVRVIFWLLLFSAQKQWTHLVVMTPADYEHIKQLPPQSKVADQDKLYLSIKNFLYGAYFEHRQADFKHAWHLLLKLGLVDLKLDDQKIMTSFAEWQAALLKK
ncbi:hypothetical protein PS3_16408 [Limosilactobacillus gastricus PS3]|uniref:dUTPase n=1 Tax=Limosilactobacillus gastricus PS3 TaxID=1144300 RepID=H4GJ94_9LACO|nr:hypothetical protein [Limosilactobacillus gastricus]EHS87019.1 hypothetical protein PS3_16408 [Limosilactobacillus gastricus PS3]